MLFLFGSVLPSCPAQVAPAKRPMIVAHYMPWFEVDAPTGRWGWHWTMNAFDPKLIVNDRRSIASHYYPLIGPYDSGDPAVIEYHLLLMKLAGIDGIIVDWYGLSAVYDYPIVHRNTSTLFEMAAKFGLRVGICYEDQTVPILVNLHKITGDERVSHAEGELKWLRQNWFSNPVYLRLHGKPVLLSFGYGGLSDAEWKRVLGTAGADVIYLSEHRKRPAADGGFDWPQPQIGLAALDSYYGALKQGDIAVPAAYPRFHDIYKEAKAQDGFPRILDEDGKTFRLTLQRAIDSGAAIVQIATWNDWGEGTNIEPSKEFGYRDLETIQRLRRGSGRSRAVSPADLHLPLRLWGLRSREVKEPSLKASLDAVAAALASGRTSKARAILNRLDRAAEKAD